MDLPDLDPATRSEVEDPLVDEDENRTIRSGFRMGVLELVLVWSGDRGRTRSKGECRYFEEALDAERSANESHCVLDCREEVAPTRLLPPLSPARLLLDQRSNRSSRYRTMHPTSSAWTFLLPPLRVAGWRIQCS